MLASLVVRLLTNVFVFVVLARVWGPREFGEFMYPFTVATLLVMIVDYGFGLQLVRDVGRSPHRVQDLVHSATGTKLLLTVGTVVLLGVAGRRLAPDTSQQWLLWLLLAAAGANSFGLFFSLPFRGLGRFELETRATLV